VSKDKKYFFNSYNEEPELEKVVVEIATDLFGEHSFIFPRSKLTSKKAELGTIPDGFLLDLSDPDNPILYVLEVELRSHGLEHIATQVLKFAISYRESKPKLNVFLKEIIRADSNLEKKIADRLKESKKFRYLDQLIDSAMDEDIPTVIIPIDGLDESLTQVQDYISVPIRYLPIETYVNPETGETLHHFKPLYQVEEAAKPTEAGTFYQFLLDDVEIIDISRSKFDEEHGISKHAQGYTFVRDVNGEPVGVVFWWYRNRVERHIKEDVTIDKKTWAGTARPVDPSSYKIDMDVYIGETIWDGDTGEKVDDPKYRIKGKLKEIYRVDGEKKTKIFPLPS
jgi:hypothetical protein